MSETKVYLDTNTFPNNIRRHDDVKSLKELAAMDTLLPMRESVEIPIIMFHSRVSREEIGITTDVEQKVKLQKDVEDYLERIPKDENIVGFNTMTDSVRTFIGFFCGGS